MNHLKVVNEQVFVKCACNYRHSSTYDYVCGNMIYCSTSLNIFQKYNFSNDLECEIAQVLALIQLVSSFDALL